MFHVLDHKYVAELVADAKGDGVDHGFVTMFGATCETPPSSSPCPVMISRSNRPVSTLASVYDQVTRFDPNPREQVHHIRRSRQSRREATGEPTHRYARPQGPLIKQAFFHLLDEAREACVSTGPHNDGSPPDPMVRFANEVSICRFQVKEKIGRASCRERV